MSLGCLEFERPSFESKVFYTDMVISKAINIFKDNVCVSWSGGKDSTFVLSRAIKQKPNIKVMWENTYIDFWQTVLFIRELTKKWNIDLIETKPLNGWTFTKCLNIDGLPKPRQTSEQGLNREPLCCLHLKKEPAIDAIEKNGIECIITGMTTAESQTRGYLKRYDGEKYKKYAGCGSGENAVGYSQFHYFVADWNVWKFNPIMNWTEKEVFDVHKRGKIPLCPVYSICGGIYKRCGCKPCTAYLDWEPKLSKTDPLVYAWLKTYEKVKYADFALVHELTVN
jgi:3'-phosphoadenosine 5'-phosphosulfate sulfotransferase (PAPS reductase)/FAD synthetase